MGALLLLSWWLITRAVAIGTQSNDVWQCPGLARVAHDSGTGSAWLSRYGVSPLPIGQPLRYYPSISFSSLQCLRPLQGDAHGAYNRARPSVRAFSRSTYAGGKDCHRLHVYRRAGVASARSTPVL